MAIWLKMAQNGLKMGQKWPSMTQNGQKWPKIMAIWLKMAQNGLKIGKKWPKMTQNGQKWPKIMAIYAIGHLDTVRFFILDQNVFALTFALLTLMERF